MSFRKDTLVAAEDGAKGRKVYGASGGMTKTLLTLEDISKSECRKRKYQLKHQIALEILEGGFHDTFSEIHHLFQYQQHLRDFYGSDSAFFLIPLLETQSDKLYSLKTMLQDGETAKRRKDYRRVCLCYDKLAHYFLDTGDDWLAEYFFDKAFAISELLTETDGGHAHAEATYHVAQSRERKDQLSTAVGFYESFYNQTFEKSWIDSATNEVLNLVAAKCLVKSYTQLSQTDPDSEHTYLQKAYDIGKKSGDLALIADASYRLGNQILAKDRTSANVALRYFLEAAEASDKLGDIERRCASQRVLAHCYDLLGNKEKSLRALMVFRELAENAQNPSNIALAHLDFGAACNNDGDYNRAVTSFTKAYTTALTAGQPTQLEVARSWVGIAMAHDYLNSFGQILTGSSMTIKESIQALAKWKATRQGLTKGPASS